MRNVLIALLALCLVACATANNASQEVVGVEAATAAATPSPEKELFRLYCGEPRTRNEDLAEFAEWKDDGVDPADDAFKLRVAAYESALRLHGTNCSGCGIYSTKYPGYRETDRHFDTKAETERYIEHVCATVNLAANLMGDVPHFGMLAPDLKDALPCERCGNIALPAPELTIGYALQHLWESKLQYAEVARRRTSKDKPDVFFSHERPLGEPIDIREELPNLRQAMARLDPDRQKEARYAPPLEDLLLFGSSIFGRAVSGKGWIADPEGKMMEVPLWCSEIHVNTVCVIDETFDRSEQPAKTVYFGVRKDGAVVTYAIRGK